MPGIAEFLAGINRGVLASADTLVGNPAAGLLNTLGVTQGAQNPITQYMQGLGVGNGSGAGQMVGEMAADSIPIAGDISGLKKDYDAWKSGDLPNWAIPLALAGALPLVPPAARYISGKLPKGALGSTGPIEAQKGVLAYHSSPHRFAPTENNPLGEFDHSRMGTGEGVQAYGWGTYLAENPGVSGHYAAKLPYVAQKRAFLDNLPEDADFRDVMDALDSFTPQQQRVLRALEADDWLGFDYPSQAISAAYGKHLDNWDPSPELVEAIQGASNTYKVDLPDEHIAKMLDWNKPLSEQPKEVQGALANLNVVAPRVEDMTREELINQLRYIDPNGVYDDAGMILEFGEPATLDELRQAAEQLELQDYLDSNIADSALANGRSLYYHLASKFGGGDPLSNAAQEAASKKLREAGIPGIKYLDGPSRAKGEGTRNFVVFDEKLMKIVDRE